MIAIDEKFGSCLSAGYIRYAFSFLVYLREVIIFWVCLREVGLRLEKLVLVLRSQLLGDRQERIRPKKAPKKAQEACAS